MNKTIFWVGEEINKGTPTQLPDMKEVVYYMVEVLCNEPGVSTFKNRIAEYNSFIREIIYNAGEILNPKALLSQWNQIEGADANEGLHCLKEAAYNKNHCLMAFYLSQGANIVTTNVDLCIEKAYHALTQEKDSMCLIDKENGVYVYSGNAKGCGKIYHLHGTCENTKELGGVNIIGKPVFSLGFRDIMERWMTEDYSIYFLGDDCGEDYDTCLFIHYMKDYVDEINCKTTLVSMKHRRKQSTLLLGILSCFDNTASLCKSVDEFIQKWCPQKYKISESSMETTVEQMMSAQKIVQVYWKREISISLYKIKPFWDIMLLYISQATCIPVVELDDGICERIETMSEPCRNMYTSLMFRFSRDLIPSYGYSQNHFSSENEDSVFLEELIRLSETPYNNNNQEIERFEHDVERIKNEYLHALRRKNSTSRYEDEANELRKRIEAMLPGRNNEKLLRAPIRNVKENAERYRLHAVLYSITCDDIEDIKRIEYDLFRAYCYCSQNGNKEGVLKTLKSAISCYLFFYYKFGKKSFYDKSQKYKTLCKRQKNSGC